VPDWQSSSPAVSLHDGCHPNVIDLEAVLQAIADLITRAGGYWLDEQIAGGNLGTRALMVTSSDVRSRKGNDRSRPNRLETSYIKTYR